MQDVEEFRAEVRGWLADNLVGEFAALKGLGGPGRRGERVGTGVSGIWQYTVE